MTSNEPKSLIELFPWAEQERIKDLLRRFTAVIEQRFVSNERGIKTITDIEDSVREALVQRLNNQLLPAVDRFQKLTELGFLIAPSTTPVTLVEGANRGFNIIAGAYRELFTPSEFVIITRESTPDTYAIARTRAYDRESGDFACTILSVVGEAGPFGDWIIAGVAGSTVAGREFMSRAQAAQGVAEARAADASHSADQSLTSAQAAAAASAASITAKNQAVDKAAETVENAEAAAASAAAAEASRVAILAEAEAILEGTVKLMALGEDVRDATITFPDMPGSDTIGNFLKLAIPPKMFNVVIYPTRAAAIAGPDQTDALTAYHNYCITAGVAPNESVGYIRTEKTVPIYSNGRYEAEYCSRNAANYDDGTKRGAVWSVEPRPEDLVTHKFNKTLDATALADVKAWGNAKRNSGRITNMTFRKNGVNIPLVGKVVSLEISPVRPLVNDQGQPLKEADGTTNRTATDANGNPIFGDVMLGRGVDDYYRQGACFFVNSSDGYISHKLMSTWQQAEWTEGNIRIETPGPRMKIKGPNVYLYGPVSGQRECAIANNRSKTILEACDINNGSGSPMSQHFLFGSGAWVGLEFSSSDKAGTNNTNYGINIGRVAGFTGIDFTGTQQRRDFDCHGGTDITLFGGNFPNGLGAHYGARFKVFGATINKGIHIAGGDFLFHACNITAGGPDNGSILNSREDGFEVWGSVVFTSCVIDYDLTGIAFQPKLVDFRPGANTSNPQRNIQFPALVSVDESNRLNVYGSSSSFPNFTLLDVFGNLDPAINKFKIETTGRILIAPQIWCEDGNYAVGGLPRFTATVTRPPQYAGDGYDIEFRNLPGIAVTAVTTRAEDVNANSRHNFRMVSCNQKGATNSKFSYTGGAYKSAQFIGCEGVFERITFSAFNGHPAVGDEERITVPTAAREETFVVTANGPFTPPPWARNVEIVCVAGGGGGGSGARGATSTARGGGAGGGAGAINRETFHISELPAFLNCAIGNGGAGANPVTADNTNGNPGSTGGTTQVSGPGSTEYYCRAFGGGGGQGGQNGGATSAGGLGGQGLTMEQVGNGGDGAPAAGSTPSGVPRGSGGGAPGGGIAANNTATIGRNGANGYEISQTRRGNGGAGASQGNVGGAGSPKGFIRGGAGGGGGGGAAINTSSPGAAGGAGGIPAAGGGGGGASTNGQASGAGAAGGRGEVWFICRS